MKVEISHLKETIYTPYVIPQCPIRSLGGGGGGGGGDKSY